MADKKDGQPWQPMLLDLRPPKEVRVEYEPAVQIRKRPSQPPAESADEVPWARRARQAEQSVPPASAGSSTDKGPWGAEWHQRLRHEGWTSEMLQGRRSELERAVRSIDVRPGVIEASVGRGFARPDRVQIRWPQLTVPEWTRLARHVIDRKSDGAVIEALRRGEIPIPLVDAADRNQMLFLPRRLGLLRGACTCDFTLPPCDHALAAHLVLARRLYKEPQLLLSFRGISSAELIALIERVRTEAAEGQPGVHVFVGGDPYARPDAPEPDWSRLERAPALRQPLPLPEGWRASQTIDGIARRAIAGARAQQEKTWPRDPSPSR